MDDKLKSREKTFLKTIFDEFKLTNLDDFTDKTYNCKFTRANDGENYDDFCHKLPKLLEDKEHYIVDESLKKLAKSFHNCLDEFRGLLFTHFTEDQQGHFTSIITDYLDVKNEEARNRLREELKKLSWDVYQSYKEFCEVIELEIDELIDYELKSTRKTQIKKHSETDIEEIDRIKTYFRDPSESGKDDSPYYAKQKLTIRPSLIITSEQATELLDLIIAAEECSPPKAARATAIYYRNKSMQEQDAIDKLCTEYYSGEKKLTRNIINGYDKKKPFFKSFLKLAIKNFN